MLASTSETSARPARPSRRPSVEGAAAAAAGAATDLVVCGFFGVCRDGAARVGFGFGATLERARRSVVRAAAFSRAAAVVLGSFVDAPDAAAVLEEAFVVAEPDEAGAG